MIITAIKTFEFYWLHVCKEGRKREKLNPTTQSQRDLTMLVPTHLLLMQDHVYVESGPLSKWQECSVHAAMYNWLSTYFILIMNISRFKKWKRESVERVIVHAHTRHTLTDGFNIYFVISLDGFDGFNKYCNNVINFGQTQF